MKRLFEKVMGLCRPKAWCGRLHQRAFSGQSEPVAVWTGPGDGWRPRADSQRQWQREGMCAKAGGWGLFAHKNIAFHLLETSEKEIRRSKWRMYRVSELRVSIIDCATPEAMRVQYYVN